MKPQEQIEMANELCQQLRRAATAAGFKDLGRERRGLQSELKKIFTFLLKQQREQRKKAGQAAPRAMNNVRRLVESLPESNFSRRSGSTPAYYRIIKNGLAGGFYELQEDDALQVLGWVCRLL